MKGTTGCTCLSTDTACQMKHMTSQSLQEQSQWQEQQVQLALTALRHELKRSAEKRGDGAGRSSSAREAESFFDSFWPKMSEEERRCLLYRFLAADGFVISRAITSCQKTAEFRRQQHVDRMLLFPSLLPLRGYDEPELCTALQLPYLGMDGQGEDTCVTAASSCTHPTVPSPRPSFERASGQFDSVDDGVVLGASGAVDDLHDYYNIDYAALYANPAAPGNVTGEGMPTTSGSQPCVSSAQPTNEDHSQVISRDVVGSAQSSLHTDATRSARRGADVTLQTAPESRSKVGLVGRLWLRVVGLLGGSDDGTAAQSGVQLDDSEAPAASSRTSPSRALQGADMGKARRVGDEQRRVASRNDDLASSGAESDVRTECFTLPVQQQQRHDANATHIDTRDGLAAAAASGDGSAAGSMNGVYNYHPMLQPIVAAILRYVPVSVHYWDKDGRPVLYCKLDTLRSKRLSDALFNLTPLGTQPVALCVLFQVYLLEVAQQLIRWNSRRHEMFNTIASTLLGGDVASKQGGVLSHKRRVSSIIVVLDSANVHYHNFLHRPLLRMVRSIVALSQRHYPELLHHLYVVNCDKIVLMSYSFIRGVMKEKTRRKVTFHNRGATPAVLRSIIADEYLPVEYGGRCNCPDGCVPRLRDEAADDAVSVASSVSSAASRASAREVDAMSDTLPSLSTRRSSFYPLSIPQPEQTARKCVIAPRRKETMAFHVSADEEVIWEFLAKKQRKVLFSAIFIPANGDGEIYTLFPKTAVCEDANHYICPSDGTVILRWRNQRLVGHSVHMHVKVYRERQN